MLRYTQDKFDSKTRTTVGLEFATKTLEYEGKIIKLQVWDTAGQERFRSMTKAYYRNASGALILYDITKMETFENSNRKWLTELKENSPSNIVVMLVGNKTDLNNCRAIPREEAENLAKEKKLLFAETSALESYGVNEAFQLITKEIYNVMYGSSNNSSSIRIDCNDIDAKRPTQSKPCC